MKLVIIAGGKGTRLGLHDIPKPMAMVAGRPILEHQIRCAARSGLTDITLLIGHLGDKIREYFGDGSRFGVRLSYVEEVEPLGTAGAVLQLRDGLQDDFMVFYGDLIMDVDLSALIAFHERHDALATITVHPNDHPIDSDLVETDENDLVTAFHSKPHDPEGCYANLVNAALYILRPGIFRFLRKGDDFGRDVFPRVLAAKGRISAYKTFEYLKDMGTPARLARVEEDLLSGKVASRNRALPQRAVFLDRDGVLNVDNGGVSRVDDLEVLPGVAGAVREINRSGRLAIVVTNQPVLAKGFCDQKTLRKIHDKLEHQLGGEGAYVDHIYFCPHHPERGFAGEVAELKADCECRKPKPGMLIEAARAFNIDLEGSYMIGDRDVDVAAGKAAGVHTVRLLDGEPGQQAVALEADYTCSTLAEAVAWIFGQDWRGTCGDKGLLELQGARSSR